VSSQESVDKQTYLAVQCVRMNEATLRELVNGPNEEWREPARKELERRASPVKTSVFGNRLSPNE
jgi:hypothetical protein